MIGVLHGGTEKSLQQQTANLSDQAEKREKAEKCSHRYKEISGIKSL